ncbi:MAG: DHH family phosphoesterase, partial [Lachnospiraceae bacterium]|nr:DHH family phosphoesterase [Lachnospiraceae bacterium]
VCDVMELTDENRCLVRQGLKLMHHSKNLGLKALIEANNIQDKLLTPYHAGFIIGPCLNATGRLDSSLRAMELFCADSVERAQALAGELKVLNDTRKQMTIDETEKAVNMILEQGTPDKVICLVLDDCHESLAGIIAGRVRERFSHPAFIFTRTENGLKGSGRSIDAYNMFEGLLDVSDELTKFGGHKLAAGLSLQESNFESFKRKINENCQLTEDDFKETVRIDMQLPLGYANLELAHDLERLEPFGTGNEAPVFAALGVTFLSGRILGANKNVAKYKISDGDGRVYDLIYFGDFEELENFVGEIYGDEKKQLLHSGMSVNVKLDICYKLSVNTFMGQETAQLQLKCYR